VNLNGLLALTNACLSTISIVCMTTAFFAIRRKRVTLHRNLMLTAASASALFLVLFVVRFVRYGFAHFGGVGAMRVVYLAVFYSHEPIAVINVPLVVAAVILGLRRSFRAHKEVAQMALPLWLYAAVTGVALYLLLYVAHF
jgi:putative membrane protein